MSARKAEQVLEALKTLLETVPQAVVERNSMLPEKSSSTAETNAVTTALAILRLKEACRR